MTGAKMALPRPDVAWPPPSVVREEQSVWGDLYAGRTIGGSNVLNPDPDLASANSERTRERRRVRGGLAADIPATSAALVMGREVPCRVEADPDVQAVWQEVDAVGGFSGVLRGAEEISSAYGGVFLRTVVNPAVCPKPYVTVVDPTRVDPVFVDGRLVAATMWTDVRVDGGSVWRWVESRDNRTRTIEQALYRGTPSNLGSRVPLDSIPETTGSVEVQPYPEGCDRMVWYHANALPNRRHPASPHGRADIQGVESLCAAVDIALTSLVADIRLGRPRIIAPTSALSGGGPGGSFWQHDREVFTTLDVDPSSEAGKIQIVQGTIRTGEHTDAVAALVERAISSAGYSPQTFGLHIDGSAPSGTALRIREARTIATVEAKRRAWTPTLIDIAQTLLVLDGVVGTVTVAWGPVRDDDPVERAQTIDILVRAKAMSVESAVEAAQPSLTPDQVQAEVDRVLSENGLSYPVGLPGTQP